jgi:hypothetical protein
VSCGRRRGSVCDRRVGRALPLLNGPASVQLDRVSRGKSREQREHQQRRGNQQRQPSPHCASLWTMACTSTTYPTLTMCVLLSLYVRPGRLDTAHWTLLPLSPWYVCKLTFFGVGRFWLFVWTSANFISAQPATPRANFSRPSSRNNLVAPLSHVHILPGLC